MSVAKRRIAPTAPKRTIDVGFDDGAYAGWRATVDVSSFPFKLLRDLGSGDLARIEAVCRRLVVSLTIDGQVTDLDDADIFGVIEIVNAAIRSKTALPNR